MLNPSNKESNTKKNNTKIKTIENKTKKLTDKNMFWGLGIEHEMQIFHSGSGNIIFDAQESTCLLTSDDGNYEGLTQQEKAQEKAQSACCKKMNKCYYYPKTKREHKILFKDHENHLTEKEFDLLINLDWELTGRQSKNCKPSSTIVKRTPRLMPELVTGSFRNRTIQSIVSESRDQENTFMSAMMKNPFTREKVEKYGKLKTHLCGTVDDIKVPIKPTITKEKYKFEKQNYKDYVGSYHITITLPHKKNISTDAFVKLHQNTANQFQWLEPLLLTAFFTGDPESVADGENPAAQGSYRIMNVGWGNLAGSDVRKFGTKGVSRGNTIPAFWRNGLRFKGLHKLNHCVKNAKPNEHYRGALSILTSDFRTFGQVNISNVEEMDYCREKYNPADCPRLDGAPMVPPYGMEIRIFDHFPSMYLLDLMKIIVLIAANADRHPPKDYVYKNKAWINQLQDIMRNGWNSKATNEYIKAINKNLGLRIKMIKDNEELTAFDLLCKVVKKLNKFNHKSYITNLLDETPSRMPKIPEINRRCWELSFKSKIKDELYEILGKMLKGRWLYLPEFTQSLFKLGKNSKNINKKSVGHQIEDILYALDSLNKVELNISKGKIKQVKIL